jgi:hypothetical protein
MDRHGVQRRIGDTAAAGRRTGSVELETFACFIDWFGNSYETQIAASDGEYPLLGTVFLDGHRLEINYGAKTVELT